MTVTWTHVILVVPLMVALLFIVLGAERATNIYRQCGYPGAGLRHLNRCHRHLTVAALMLGIPMIYVALQAVGVLP